MGFSVAVEEEEKQASWGHLLMENTTNNGNNNHHHHHQIRQQQNNQISFEMMNSSSSVNPAGNFISKESTTTTTTNGAYDLGELDQALFLYLEGQHDHQSSSLPESTGIRPPTLNIFPSQPMHVEPSNTRASVSLVSPTTSSSSKRPSESTMELTTTRNDVVASRLIEPSKAVKVGFFKREGHRKGATSSSEHEGPKTPDPKTLRRLAQNREAARKSRLRKKAYVQQLETSRIKLTQLEQELQRARSQGVFFGGGGMIGDQGLPAGINNMSAEAAVFDMEYTRWLEEHHRLMCDLQTAVQEHVQENELRLYVDNCLAHYDEMMGLKSMVVKNDVFHLVSGMWKTPAERCFIWMGGFRPSEMIKVILNHIEPLSEQQIMGICGLQQSTQEAEDALNQGLEALNQSLSDTIAADSLTYPSNMANYMGQMALAMNKLTTIEGFVRQADNLRHQTLRRLHHVLTTRQSARCFLAMAEYSHRLRALSSLWVSRPRPE